jgi:hypothetical protein
LSEYVIRIIGRLMPPLTVEYKDLLELPSFSITVDKEMVNAVPQSDLQLHADEAKKRLQEEISPLLLVLGTEVEKRPIALEITDVAYPTFGIATRDIACRANLRDAPPTKDDIHLKFRWAASDPTYCDLLDYYSKAQGASNPRPFGYNMVERLEKRFGSRDNACKALDIKRQELIPIADERSEYQDDRHAKHDVGKTPSQLPIAKRNDMLVLLRRIIVKYEENICTTPQEST